MNRFRSAVSGIVLMLAAHPAVAASFTFGWPVPVTVAVKAKMDKRGNTSTARYLAELAPGEDGHLTLSFRDFEFLTLNGVDARTPEVQAKLGPLAALTATLPAMRVSQRGDYLGTVGLERMAERMFALLPDADDPQLRERMDAYFASPQVRQMMQQKSGEVWNTWVGAWNGLELAAGESLQRSVPVTVMARELEQAMLFEHLGAAGGSCAACVRLRLTTLLEGPEVVALVAGMVRELAGEKDALAMDAFESARSSSVIDIVTDGADLRPRHVRASTTVMVRERGGRERSRSEHKEYWFQWQ